MFRFNSAFVIYRNTVTISELNYTKCFWIRDMIIFLLFAQELAAAPPCCSRNFPFWKIRRCTGRKWPNVRRCRVTTWNKFGQPRCRRWPTSPNFFNAADGTEGHSKKQTRLVTRGITCANEACYTIDLNSLAKGGQARSWKRRSFRVIIIKMSSRKKKKKKKANERRKKERRKIEGGRREGWRFVEPSLLQLSLQRLAVYGTSITSVFCDKVLVEVRD